MNISLHEYFSNPTVHVFSTAIFLLWHFHMSTSHVGIPWGHFHIINIFIRAFTTRAIAFNDFFSIKAIEKNKSISLSWTKLMGVIYCWNWASFSWKRCDCAFFPSPSRFISLSKWVIDSKQKKRLEKSFLQEICVQSATWMHLEILWVLSTDRPAELSSCTFLSFTFN